MAYMFCGCSSLGFLNVFDFDTSACGDMRHMFSGCPAPEVAEDALWFDFSASGQTYDDLFA
jgi:hypothetical protein